MNFLPDLVPMFSSIPPYDLCPMFRSKFVYMEVAFKHESSTCIFAARLLKNIKFISIKIRLTFIFYSNNEMHNTNVKDYN